MPQLSLETFVSQYFWLIVTLFTLYFIMVTKLLPLISEAFKVRSNLETKVANVQKNIVKDSLLIKDIASLQFVPTLSSTSYYSPFANNFLAWSNKAAI
jgi:hypothetical protein